MGVRRLGHGSVFAKIGGLGVEAFVDGRLTLAALRMALGQRHPDATLVHHSDRGVPYAATAYRTVLEGCGITLSMSRKGNCYDNGVPRTPEGDAL
ncbi:MAG: hypothetical protein R3B95_07700 [Nitrospirales bacterium]|nr:hypothetical protein [Nitrospirales bacterium]